MLFNPRYNKMYFQRRKLVRKYFLSLKIQIQRQCQVSPLSFNNTTKTVVREYQVSVNFLEQSIVIKDVKLTKKSIQQPILQNCGYCNVSKFLKKKNQLKTKNNILMQSVKKCIYFNVLMVVVVGYCIRYIILLCCLYYFKGKIQYLGVIFQVPLLKFCHVNFSSQD